MSNKYIFIEKFYQTRIKIQIPTEVATDMNYQA